MTTLDEVLHAVDTLLRDVLQDVMFAPPDLGLGAGVDNLLLESGDNLLLEDGASVLLLE